MLDQFIWGRVSRISPEAPVPVVQVTKESVHLGGAANVAVNVRALGGHAKVVGIVGADEHGRRVTRELRKIGVGTEGIIASRTLHTIQKIRILAHQQQVVRLDREFGSPSAALGRQVVERVRRALRSVDGVVVSDYAKGVITPELLDLLADRRKDLLLLVDPKKGNFDHYRQATLVKPNLEAAADAAGIPICDARSLQKVGRALVEKWQAEAVLISQGEQGMTLFRGRIQRHFSTAAREVYDVTGAGDTVLAAAALALGVGASFEQAAVLANRAAGIVVAKIGTASASSSEILRRLREEDG
jgi:D-beta-D-heptose 7-phosphate kinase/D-beta-D-heptose 1-phosphate adenosyltransferase